MKDINGESIYEVSDAIQVVRGQDAGTFGIVLENLGNEIKCWGRVPASYGSQAYTFHVRSSDVMYIGRGKIRPLLPGEIKRDINSMGHNPAPVRQPAQLRRPRITPPQESEGQVQTPPATTEPAPAGHAPPVHRASVAPAVGDLQFGGVDSDSIRVPRPPAKYEEPTPEMLTPAVFHGPSARDLMAKSPSPQPQEQHVREEENHSVPPQGDDAPSGGGEAGSPAQGLGVQIPRASLRPRRRKVSDVATAADAGVRDGGGSDGIQGSPAEGSEAQV